MAERHFRMIIGAALLIILYFNLTAAMVGLLAVMVFEALTNWRVPLLVSRLRYGMSGPSTQRAGGPCPPPPEKPRFNFEAERMLRLVVAAILAVSYFAFPGPLWFLPWFVGFALVGAGLSGVCPMVMALRVVGFR